MDQVSGNDAVCGSALELMTDGPDGLPEGDCFTLDRVPFGRAVTISLWALLHTDEAGVRTLFIAEFAENLVLLHPLG